jgi:hypothetical protein
MNDEHYSKSEEEFKANQKKPELRPEDRPPEQASVGHKKNDMAEIRSVRAFISWFMSWEFKNVLTWPVIYGMIFPLLLLDMCVSIYQSFCFRIYGIQRVRRSDYFQVKRHKLGYLNIVEKMNCDFCGYANGLIAFTREVFARTEQYWCPIKHADKIAGAHERYENFLKYGEVEGYHEKLEALRKELSDKDG